MSANMFGYAAGASFMASTCWALNKQQMYNGDPSPQVVDFAGDSSDFTVIPANSRLQTGTPPAGSPEYFVSTEQFLNALSIYKFHVDWDKISTSTFTGPQTQLAPNCWPNATPCQRLDAGERGRHARDPRDGAGPVLEPRRRRVALGRPHRAAQRQRDEHDLQRDHRRQRHRPLVPGQRHRRHRRGERRPGRDLRPGRREHVLPLHAGARGRPQPATWRSPTRSRTRPRTRRSSTPAGWPGDPANTLRADRADADRRHRRAERQLRAARPAPAGATTAAWRSTRTAASSGCPASTTRPPG